MKPIHPICEENCREHYGKPVLIIMKDGSELVGILSRFDQDKIILNGETTEAEQTETNTAVKKTKRVSVNNNRKKNTGRAVISAYPGGGGLGPNPYFPYGGALVLDLALIALLFALI